MGLQFPVFLFLISLSKFGIGPYVSYWFPVSSQASDKGPFINSIMEQFSLLVDFELNQYQIGKLPNKRLEPYNTGILCTIYNKSCTTFMHVLFSKISVALRPTKLCTTLLSY